MGNETERLLTAYEESDSRAFAAICAQLVTSKSERRETAERLLEIVSEGHSRRAEVAVNILRFSGIASENEWYERLITVAEKAFSPEAVSRLATSESNRGRVNRKLSPEARLLRSLISALMSKQESRAIAFVETVENQLAGTTLAARIARWKHAPP